MKITVVTNIYWPDEAGAAAIITDLCEGLVERGFEVTVLTTYPYFPEWRRKRNVPEATVQESFRNGVCIRRHWIYVPKNPSNLFERLLYEISFFLSLLRSLCSVRHADALVAFSTMGGQLGFSVLARWLLGCRLWINVQDILGDAMSATKLGSSLAGRFFGRVQRFIYRRADHLSAISPEMRDRLEELARPNQPVEMVPNWIHSDFQRMIDVGPGRSSIPPQRPWNLVYAGNLGRKQGLDLLCLSLHRSEIDFSMEIWASGGEAHRTRNCFDEAADPRFSFGPILPPAEYIEVLKKADFFVISQRSGIGNSFIPSKLITCIACGTPILAVCDRESPLGNEVRKFNLGGICEWTELDRLEDVLKKMSENWKDHLKACANRSKDYGHKAGIDRCASLLTEMVREKSDN